MRTAQVYRCRNEGAPDIWLVQIERSREIISERDFSNHAKAIAWARSQHVTSIFSTKTGRVINPRLTSWE